MNKIEDDDDGIDTNNLAFIGSNQDKFNFNTFYMPLNFILNIYNGKISLKEAEFKQTGLKKEIENLQFYYIPKNKKEKEKIEEVLRHADELLECRDKIIKALKDGIFLSEHLKKIRCYCLQSCVKKCIWVYWGN